MKFRQSLFWDTDPKRIDVHKNARYIIERILELGQPDEVRWLFETYPKNQLEQTMNLPRAQISSKSKALWSLLTK
ncbi:MAG: hypothetical protein AAB863_01220 [Patescibacteria group bacterium]